MEIEFPDGVFFLELVEYSNLAVSRSGASLPRTPPRTFSSTSHLLAPLAPPCRPLAGCEFHDSCPPVCAGSKLNIYRLLPERAAASLAGAGVFHAPMRLVGPRPAHAAHICLRAAGPRATPCTASDEPGRLLCFLVINFLIVLSFLLALSVCGVEVSGSVL